MRALRNLWNPRTPSRRSTARPARYRKIGFDHLENRSLMAGVELADIAPPVDELAGGQESVEVAGISQSSAEDLTIATSENGGGGENSLLDSQGSAPVLLSLDWFNEDYIYTFWGFVSDDGDASQLMVHFGGEISGASTEVYEGGFFWFVIELHEPWGGVTAQAQDGDGLWSNQEYVFIW